jgi:hypothetical protein
MKTKVALMVLAVAAIQTVALAQQTPTMAVATTKVDKKIEVSSPLLKVTQPVKKENATIDRVGGVSSRPWTQTVGWHNGQSTEWNADTHEAQLCVLSIGR